MAGLTLFGVEKLVDDNRVDVDLVLRELLDEALRLVQRQELRDCDGCVSPALDQIARKNPLMTGMKVVRSWSKGESQQRPGQQAQVDSQGS